MASSDTNFLERQRLDMTESLSSSSSTKSVSSISSTMSDATSAPTTVEDWLNAITNEAHEVFRETRETLPAGCDFKDICREIYGCGVPDPSTCEDPSICEDISKSELRNQYCDLLVNGPDSEGFKEVVELINLIKLDEIQSPLDQFAILPLIPIHIGDLYVSFTNSGLFMLQTLTSVLLLFYFLTKKGGGKLVPNAWQSLVELLYDFVLNLVNEQIGGRSGNVKQKFFPCILVTFLFLLFCNLQGMIPYSFTVTSHFLITLGLSFSLFIGITIVGFQKNGLHFLSFLLPAGVPLPLAPFLVLLELISYCFRALSLGIRLFANMMAGHSLVKILSGFAWTMLCMNNLFYFIGHLAPLFIVLALTGLELGVAILQAYVFTILICIYLNDAINLH